MEEFKSNEYAVKPLKGILPDILKTPMKKDGTHEKSDFHRFAGRNLSTLKSPLSTYKRIEPLVENEKVGLKWAFSQRSRSMMANY